MISDRKPYDHSQQAPTAVLVIPLIVLIGVGVGLARSPKPVDRTAWPIVLIAVGVALASMTIFSRLRIEVRDGVLRWAFGWGFPRFSLAISEIQSATLAKNPWFYGVGIHLTPMGMIYNVWGRRTVQITKTNGRRLRLGTDDPEALLAAIQSYR